MSYVKTGAERGISAYGALGWDVPGTCPDGYSWSWDGCQPDAPPPKMIGGAVEQVAQVVPAIGDRAMAKAYGCNAHAHAFQSPQGPGCECDQGYVLVGTDCVLPQPGGGCPAGYMKDQYGNCSVAAMTGEDYCAADDPYSIYRASDNACVCKPGYHRPAPEENCVKDQPGVKQPPPPAKNCPVGTTGTYPNCKPKSPAKGKTANAPAPAPPPPANKAWILAAVGGGAILLIAGAAMLGSKKKKKSGDKADQHDDKTSSGE